MTTYNIPVSWQVYSVFEVDASNLSEAIYKTYNEIGLNECESSYIDDSFEILDDLLEMYNPKCKEEINSYSDSSLKIYE